MSIEKREDEATLQRRQPLRQVMDRQRPNARKGYANRNRSKQIQLE